MTEVDISGSDPLLVTVTELARLKGLTRQAISKRLARLVGEGLITVRQRGREKLIALAQWDAVTEDSTDLAKVAGHATRAARAGGDELAGAPRDPSYTQELTRKARYDADLKALELDRQMRRLVPIEDLTDAAGKIGESLVRNVEMLPTWVEDLMAAHASGGTPAMRERLRELARSMREKIVADLGRLAAPAEEPRDGFDA